MRNWIDNQKKVDTDRPTDDLPFVNHNNLNQMQRVAYNIIKDFHEK